MSNAPQPKKKMSMMNKILIFFIILIVFILFITRNEKHPQQQQQQQQQTPTIQYPQNETAFIDINNKAIEQAKKAENDMQKGGALSERNKNICATLTKLTVVDWIGEIKSINSNSDGHGVLEITIAPNIIIKTWNNAISDTFNQTLIQPSTPLFDTVSKLKKGQKVKFSGNFFKEEGTCILESSLRLDGKLKKPEYIFKFTQVTPL